MAERIRFYADEHVPAAIIAGVRRRGGDIVTVQEAGLRGADDESQLAYAVNTGRVILTQDADFLRLDAGGHAHLGIVYAGSHLSIGDIIRGLMLLHELFAPEEMANQVEFLSG
jgi:hypothetical protein